MFTLGLDSPDKFKRRVIPHSGLDLRPLKDL